MRFHKCMWCSPPSQLKTYVMPFSSVFPLLLKENPLKFQYKAEFQLFLELQRKILNYFTRLAYIFKDDTDNLGSNYRSLIRWFLVRDKQPQHCDQPILVQCSISIPSPPQPPKTSIIQNDLNLVIRTSE